jgi:flavin-binding protein dodecin
MIENHVKEIIEITGSSPKSIEYALVRAFERAAEAAENMHWPKITQTRGQIVDGMIEHWQAASTLGFMRLDPAVHVARTGRRPYSEHARSDARGRHRRTFYRDA